jgi:opacity protein-like surface antigen
MGIDSLVRAVTLLSVLSWYPSFTDVAFPAEFGDIELSGYALGMLPGNQDLFNQGTIVSTSVHQGLGAGFKIGVFPSALNRAVGLEMDSNIHGTALSFPNIANGRHNETGRSDLLMINTTFNVILRYPGERIRPYIGGGIGWSHATLLNPNIAGRDDKDFDSARAFTYQFLGGTQVVLNPHVSLFGTQQTVAIFLFGEYRYLSSNYHWGGLAVDFRTHYGLLGVGLRF